jgi:hypothetical protein
MDLFTSFGLAYCQISVPVETPRETNGYARISLNFITQTTTATTFPLQSLIRFRRLLDALHILSLTRAYSPLLSDTNNPFIFSTIPTIAIQLDPRPKKNRRLFERTRNGQCYALRSFDWQECNRYWRGRVRLALSSYNILLAIRELRNGSGIYG